MSDMADDFNALRKARQEKRSDNREHSAAVLTRAGVQYEVKNLGAHLVVQAGAQTVDFWPGTGLWIVRGSPTRRRGVRKLVEYVTEQRAARSR
ncbi:hypothetical protein IP92_04905 [Pseudoduganella flava]|uniref:Uncharacterized protein n=1 Tax=Pseudoduganella flava TaxID=871742 RepID=A0A562PHZ1_9BURK|nr:hypothetical protein [Pseudoduganella flava]QGZ42684.1 hypothetical protein GO485_29065 [Pseudoduganella flava]TWI43850.1 hypothetical protein IP92_04905 [Pseudoduganella flava]